MVLLPRRVVFGASIDRVAAPQLRDKIPYVVLDGLDNALHGGDYYQTDGRGLITPPTHGGLNIAEALDDEIARGILRVGSACRDWVVVDFSLGTEDLVAADPVIDSIIDTCVAGGFRLAWVLPHIYYGAKTPEQQAWNETLTTMLIGKIALNSALLDARLIDWDYLVTAWTDATPSLTDEARAVGQPLLYDGRHPTPARGCERYACAIQEATGL